MTYEDFLTELDLTEEDYFKAVQTSVKAPKVFLERPPRDKRVNPYMRHLITAWQANHDIQFVLDAYACAMYIVSYISKSQRGMSTLLYNAAKEAKK